MFGSARPSVLAGVRYFAKRAEIKAPIQLHGVSGQYAHALFGFASTEDALEIVEKDLSTFKTALDTVPHFADILQSPVIANSQRDPVIREALEKAGAHKVTKSFMRVVTEGGRTPILAGIIDGYSRLMRAHRKEVDAVLSSAEVPTLHLMLFVSCILFTETDCRSFPPPKFRSGPKPLRKSTPLQAAQSRSQPRFCLFSDCQLDPTLMKGVAFEMNNEYYDFSAKPIDTLIRKEWSDAISAYFDNKLREIENYEKTFDTAH